MSQLHSLRASLSCQSWPLCLSPGDAAWGSWRHGSVSVLRLLMGLVYLCLQVQPQSCLPTLGSCPAPCSGVDYP